MDQAANLPSRQRAELFRETGSRRGIGSAVAEKDFWVCWVLKRLFADPAIKEHIVFKGGTTLSKVFGIIERFSEDVDLILDWYAAVAKYLGAPGVFHVGPQVSGRRWHVERSPPTLL